MDASIVAGFIVLGHDLLQFLRDLPRSRQAKSNQLRTAIASLQHAVLETQSYIAAGNRGEAPKRDAEIELSRVWQRASLEFYRLDGDLANRLQLKAEYWRTPEIWTSQQVVDAGISLDQIAQLTRQLLYEGR